MPNEILTSADLSLGMPTRAEIADIAALSLLIRLSIDLAVEYKLVETEHELRRALLGLHLAVPEVAALALAMTHRTKPS